MANEPYFGRPAPACSGCLQSNRGLPNSRAAVPLLHVGGLPSPEREGLDKRLRSSACKARGRLIQLLKSQNYCRCHGKHTIGGRVPGTMDRAYADCAVTGAAHISDNVIRGHCWIDALSCARVRWKHRLGVGILATGLFPRQIPKAARAANVPLYLSSPPEYLRPLDPPYRSPRTGSGQQNVQVVNPFKIVRSHPLSRTARSKDSQSVHFETADGLSGSASTATNGRF